MKCLWLVALFSVACSSSGSVGGADTCAEPTDNSGSWTGMALPPSGVGAVTPAFAWTGEQLVVWGGAGLNTETGSCAPCKGGGIYQPMSNSWRAMSDTGAPSPRDWTAGVWAGDRFVTWGGLSGTPHQHLSVDETGGIYDMSLDAWQSMSTKDQPQWRWQHALVWTGREVLVWGGANADNVRLCDGSKFDPVQNVWKSMSLEEAPLGCLQPATAWTGKELLIWGGGIAQADGSTTNTGAAYSPDADTWRPISNVGAPSARHSPAVVWTGQEMIVYGGNAGVDARAYDPFADRWRPLNLRGNPGLHTRGDAVWTGSEMILWGRSDCDVGGRYDLASDTWQTFSSRGALKARRNQAVIWTGDAMLIYGGIVGIDVADYETNSGALYMP